METLEIITMNNTARPSRWLVAAPLIWTFMLLIGTPSLDAQTLQVSVPNLQFSVRDAADTAPAQTVSVAFPGDPVNYAASVGYVSSKEGWLSVTPEKGVTPSTLNVNVDAHNLQDGMYMGYVKIGSASAESTFVMVTLKVGDLEHPAGSVESRLQAPSSTLEAGPRGSGTPARPSRLATAGAIHIDTSASGLSVTPTNISFPTTAQGASNPTGTISVTSSQSGETFYVDYVSGCNLFNLSTLGGTAPTTITVTALVSAAPANLTSNEVCNATYRIYDPNQNSTVIDVTLSITITPASGGSTNPSLTASPTQLNFSQTVGGTAPASQSIQISSNSSTATSFTVTHSPSWLNVTPTSGSASSSAPATLTVSVSGSALTASATPYTDTITITGGGTSATVAVSFTVSAASSTVTASPTQLTFSGLVGGSSPAAQSIQLTSTSATATSFSVTHTAAATWLTVTPTSGTVSSSSPASLSVSVNPAGLTPSTTPYSDTITITAGSATITVGVTFTLSAGTAAVAPTALTFTTILHTSPVSQILTLTNTGAAASFTASTNASWLSVTPSSGSVSSSASVSLTVAVNASTLSAGSYSGNVAIVVGTTTLNVPVTIALNAASGLTASPASLLFSQTLSGTTPSPQTIQVTSTAGATAFTVMVTSSWLTVTPLSATTPATLSVSVDPTGLSAGTQEGLIQVVFGSNVVNIPVTYTISNYAPQLSATPTSLSFSQITGGSAPASQSVNVTSSSGAVTFTVRPSGNWLSVSAPTGTTPANIAISVNSSASSLASGSYAGSVTFAAGSTSVVVPATLIVGNSAFTLQPASLSFTGAAGAAAPASQTVAVSSTGAAVSFTAVASTTDPGNWLTVTPTSGTTPASLQVSVSTAALAAGQYTGTVVVTPAGSSLSPQTLNVSLTLSATSAGTPPNVLSVLNGASLQPGPLAPGEIITIFGTGLGPATGLPATVLPAGAIASTLGGTTVLFDGIPAPLLYVQSNQINAIVPYAMEGRATATFQIQVSGASASSLDLRINETAPAIFTVNGSGSAQGAIVNQDGTVNGPYYPAPRGSVISIYATGEGQTNPAGQDGRIITTDLRVPLAPVSAIIGLVPAQVTYAGSAPGLVAGVIQINAYVPANAPVGGQIPIVFLTGTTASGAMVTMAVK
jgi:uncharacterized protein (TIGR03437 family)